MTTPINPYVAGNPVGDSPAFIGRVDVLREVVRVLRRPQDNAIVLYGQRRIGKTSILQHLEAWLPREGPYHPVYFDLQDKAAWSLGRVLQDLARAIAHTLGQPDPDLGTDTETTFRWVWLPTILRGLPEESSLVLLFDEFDMLADPKAEQAAAALFPYLRSLLESDPQRLEFVFAVGRNMDDLANIALSLFKGTPARRVSLLNREDTVQLVRLSQENNTLTWSDAAVECAWQLTRGHPFLTQQLCSHVWEQAYDIESNEPPVVTLAEVNAAVADALEASRNTMAWLWDGLPPAGRVVISALAEAGPRSITQDELEQLLRESGVRVVIRELQNAPQLLQDWDLIEPSDGGYRFRVELLRCWIAENKPLRRVQDELDRIEPVAESFYQAALGLYRGKQLDQAMAPLRQAIGLNPNHVGANQVLADILLAQGHPGEARQLLERLYEYQPAAARARLVQALLAQVQEAKKDDERLNLYERVLRVDIAQPEAAAGWQRIWQQRGDIALAGNDLTTALGAYRTAGLPAKVTEVQQKIRRQELEGQLALLNVLEQQKRYSDALDLAQKLAGEYSDMRDWKSDFERLENKIHLDKPYRRALEALYKGDMETGKNLLAEVVGLEPGYEQAIQYLYFVMTGVDVTKLQNRLKEAERDRQNAEAYAKEAERDRQNVEAYAKEAQLIEEEYHKNQDEIKHLRSRLEQLENEQKTYQRVPERPKQSQSQKETSKRTLHHLSPSVPLDQLHLLWWALVTPKQLKIYRQAFGEKDELRVGKWLASTLIWLPFLLPTFSLGLGAIHHIKDTFSSPIYLLISISIVVAWVLTALLGKTDGDHVELLEGIVAGLAAGIVAGILAFFTAFSIAFGAAVGVMATIMVGVAISVTVGIAVGVAVRLSSGAVGSVALGVAVGLAGGVASDIAFATGFLMPDTTSVVTGIIAGVVTFSIAVGAALASAFGVSYSMYESLETGRSNRFTRGTFGLLLVIFAFLIWFAFLNGWRVFQ